MPLTMILAGRQSPIDARFDYTVSTPYVSHNNIRQRILWSIEQEVHIIMKHQNRITIKVINPNSEADTVRYLREIICASNSLKAQSNKK